ncbi:MAG: hypothetical protein R2867_01680 [Caldilineaceae bacterium]
MVERPIYVPCPAEAPPQIAVPDPNAPYLEAPVCAEPESEIVVTGHNFAPNTTGPLNFIPPSGVSLQLARIETDGSGNFELTVELRDRTAAEAQSLRAVTRQRIGWPHLSLNGRETLAKILETVFMALLATTIGTMLAIPLSFFAARNLMRTVTSPLTSVALSLIAAPLGAAIGLIVARLLAAPIRQFDDNIALNVGSAILLPLLIWGIVLWVMAPTRVVAAGEMPASPRSPVITGVAFLLIAAATLLTAYALANVLDLLGQSLELVLGDFAFLGGFLLNLGGILRLLIAPVCAVIGAGVLMNFAGQLGQRLVERLAPSTGKVLNLVVAALAGATLFALLGAVVAWLYELRNPALTLYWPALVGAVGGLLVALRIPHNASLPVGLAMYTVARTIFNALRSIEALIMVIVFAVWVGIGPFAGVLALGLHTVAALAKLYSEQVEHFVWPAGSCPGHRGQPAPNDRLRRHPANCATLHLFYHVPLGYQRAHVDDHRFCRRRWHWLPAPAKYQPAQLSRGQCADLGHCHRGLADGLSELRHAPARDLTDATSRGGQGDSVIQSIFYLPPSQFFCRAKKDQGTIDQTPYSHYQ